MRPSSVLVFDLGGVLVHTRGFESLQRLLALSGAAPLDDQSLRDRWLSSPSVRRFELGRTSAPEFAEGLIREWDLPVPADALVEDLAGWIEGPYAGAEELLADLRPDHTLCCFSNSNELHWQVMAGFLENFHFAFSSHLLGEIKPDARAFRAVLAALGAEAGEVRFFDDSRANVTAAKELGIRAYLVNGPDDIREALRGEGLV